MTASPWNSQRPHTLVVACSDGRLQENLDDFLHHYLGIAHYDRLYAPGGGGALARCDSDDVRVRQFRQECGFLLRAHAVHDLILIFHGPADEGPDEAACADYRRRWPGASLRELRQQQEEDAKSVKSVDWGVFVQSHVFRCEVTADRGVQFVQL